VSDYPELANRLERMRKHVGKWARRQGITCYRIYEKDIADQPLIVDWYDGDVVAWAFPRTRNDTPEAERDWIDGVQRAICAGFDVAPERIFFKQRGRQEDRQHGGQYQPLEQKKIVKTVIENGLKFEINLSDYVDVGLFLDHRPLRARVRAESAGKDVLNLFCYTGSFTCNAAAGSAKSTTSVDLSNTYLDWAGRNLRGNGIADTDAHRLLKVDCLRFLDDERAQGRFYDLIICDPPTFSNSTGMRDDFAVGRDHPRLIAQCAALLRPDGCLYFSTNFRGFELDRAALPPLQVEELSKQTVADDFRNKRIHRCWQIRK
jgi:23S rRNA (cytosine1962-C5)-methyltransferase